MIINRVWEMPNSKTFKINAIKNIILKYIKENDLVLDPFANESSIKEYLPKCTYISNDLDTQYNTDYHEEAQDFLSRFEDNSVDVVLYDPPYCYDKETEIFTSTGFKKIQDVNYNDILATLDTTTNQLVYQKPTEIIKRKYSGEMIQIDSQSISLLVTPNHRCWVKNSFYGKYQWKLANELFNNTSKVWFQKSCMWKGEEKEFFYLPEIHLTKKNRFGEKIKHKKAIPMDTWLKFLGLYLSEGCYRTREHHRKNSKSTKEYFISIAQVKESGRKEIIDVLNELGYNYYIGKNDFRISDKQLFEYLKQFGKTLDKYIPQEIKNLSSRQLQILIDYLMIGDGTHIKYKKLNKLTNKVYHYTTNSYSTSSKQLMNDFAEIAIKCGYGVTISQELKKGKYNNINYSIHMLKAKHFRVNKKNYYRINNYNDYVYCVSVPNTTLLVKRSGRVFWCGNSGRQVAECYKSLNKTITMSDTNSGYFVKFKEQIARILKPNGIVITCGWNTNGIGKKYDMELIEVLDIAHGGAHYDTLVTVEQKVIKKKSLI